MQEMFTFDDVLIVPKFSTIESRKDVNITTNIRELYFKVPIISANMDTVTGPEMAQRMMEYGAQACLHRFGSVDDTIKQWKDCKGSDNVGPLVSIGLGTTELERAEALFGLGAHTFVIDVAHGAQMAVAKQAKALRQLLGRGASIVAGNFASAGSVKDFLEYADESVHAIKVGIGPGSACTTRIKTGVGFPQLSAVKEIAHFLRYKGITVIADGGMKTPGDIAKALGAGASMVMLGGMLAGTYETPGETVQQDGKPCNSVSFDTITSVYKKYRGSASKESYEVQGKDASWRTAEGESFLVPYKGPVKEILQDIEGGLRSAMSYVGARNLKEFHAMCEFVRITPSTVAENGAHGKKR